MNLLHDQEPSELGRIRDAFVAGATRSPFFPSTQHRRALEFMGHVLWSRRSIGAVTALSGCGKTFLIRRFVEDLDQRVLVAEVHRTGVDCRQFLVEVLRQYGLTVPDTDAESLHRILDTFLHHQSLHGRFCLLLIEDAQRMHPTVLEALARLARIECDGKRVLKVLLLGEPSLRHVVASPRMREAVRDDVALFVIDRLSEDQTAAYVAHRLRAVGIDHPDELISSQLAIALHRCTLGVPGLVNRLCVSAAEKALASASPRLTLDAIYAAAAESGCAASNNDDASAAPAQHQTLRAVIRLSMQGHPDREIELDTPRLLIGRGAAADVVIDSMLVSRHHALLVREPGRDLLIDLGSTNGLSVNAVAVSKHVLRHRDLIQVGPARLVYLNPADAWIPGEDPGETQLVRQPGFAAAEGTTAGSLLLFGRTNGR